MSKIADTEANATSLDGLVNDNALVPTLRNGPKPSYQYLVNGWNSEFNLAIEQYKESRGFNTKGTFAGGFAYELPNDVGLDADGNPWILIDTSSLPVTVAAGTTPTNPPYKQVIYGTAAQVSTNTSDTVQSFVDSFALKIFQSPTDGGLTEIQTRTVDANEVYEVRKTSDDSLATIYSDEAGTVEIVQNGVSNKSNASGEVSLYIKAGSYYIEVGLNKTFFSTDLAGSFVTSFEGSTPRTLSARFSEFKNIKDFEYLVDKSNSSKWDWTLAIQTCLDLGGKTYLPSGEYYTSGNIISVDGTAVVGDGDNSEIKAVNNLSETILLNAGVVDSIEIRNIKLSSIGAADGIRTLYGICLLTGGVTNSTFDNITMYGGRICWWYSEESATKRGSENNIISNIRMSQCNLWAFYLRSLGTTEAESAGKTVVSNVIITNCHAGLVLAEGDANNYSFSNIQVIADTPLHLEVCTRIRISNSYFKCTPSDIWDNTANISDYGGWIVSNSFNNCKFSNCVFDARTQWKIWAGGFQECGRNFFNNCEFGEGTLLSFEGISQTDTNKDFFTTWRFNNCDFKKPTRVIDHNSSDISQSHIQHLEFHGCDINGHIASRRLGSLTVIGGTWRDSITPSSAGLGLEVKHFYLSGTEVIIYNSAVLQRFVGGAPSGNPRDYGSTFHFSPRYSLSSSVTMDIKGYSNLYFSGFLTGNNGNPSSGYSEWVKLTDCGLVDNFLDLRSANSGSLFSSTGYQFMGALNYTAP